MDLSVGLIGIPKVSVGGVELAKISVGEVLIWPANGWQSGSTEVNKTYTGTGGAVVNFYPLPNGTLTIQTNAPSEPGIDTWSGFSYFVPTGTDVTAGNFFRVLNDATPGSPGPWTAIASFYAPQPLSLIMDAANPSAVQTGSIEFSETSGGTVVATVFYDFNLTYIADTSGFQPMTNGLIESWSSSANNISSTMRFNSSDGTTVGSITGGTKTESRIKNWWFGTPLPTTCWARVRTIVNSSGGSLSIQKNKGSAQAAGVWFDFNSALGVNVTVSGSGSSSYTRYVDMEIDFSESAGGGGTVTTSSFTVRARKL